MSFNIYYFLKNELWSAWLFINRAYDYYDLNVVKILYVIFYNLMTFLNEWSLDHMYKHLLYS